MIKRREDTSNAGMHGREGAHQSDARRHRESRGPVRRMQDFVIFYSFGGCTSAGFGSLLLLLEGLSVDPARSELSSSRLPGGAGVDGGCRSV
jgi:hypothetical protein